MRIGAEDGQAVVRQKPESTQSCVRSDPPTERSSAMVIVLYASNHTRRTRNHTTSHIASYIGHMIPYEPCATFGRFVALQARHRFIPITIQNCIGSISLVLIEWSPSTLPRFVNRVEILPDRLHSIVTSIRRAIELACLLSAGHGRRSVARAGLAA